MKTVSSNEYLIDNELLQQKKYLLVGNTFFSTFILNWTDKKLTPEFKNKGIYIPIVPSSAQVINDQRSLVRLLETDKEDSTIGVR
ncbi:hypothetical protein MUGA111182_17805 [Mucilaginibacter galii]|uniref:Uncharacterized protein n=1 Tax=Mucilaginibacter galii TaxID=2005073 RepID=A0A917N4R6_9SPHI|nr:hypothetical protein GCM10011425_36290 [Mucilaginibacter galii]